MTKLKEFLKPSKKKAFLSVLLFLAYFFAVNFWITCPLYARICREEDDFNLGERVPFSCFQACTIEEYNYELAKTALNSFIVPLIAAYLIACTFLHFYKCKKKRNK